MAEEIRTRSRKPRRALRWVGILFGVLVLLLVVAYFVGTSEWALKSVVLPKVSKAMNADVTVESASISPFSAVTLRGLTVETAATLAERQGSARSEPLLTAKEVRARYSLMDIIKGNIHVSEVALESPVVNLVTFPDGTSNLDPITKEKPEQKPKEPKDKDSKSEKPPQVNLQKFLLNNATVRKIDQRKDGTRQLLELTGVTVTAEDIANGKTGQLGLAANIRMDQGLSSTSNGVLAATVGGRFNFTFDPALKPQVVKGQTKLDVTEAKGAFQQIAALGVTLNADLTPSQLNDVSVQFAQSGRNLGAISARGPFSAETMEGKLAVNISQIDRQVLNLAGAVMGIDFNQTAIDSTNTVELAQRGRMINVNGALLVNNFSATQKGQNTPVLNLRTDYAVVYDQTNKTALIQQFALNGTQNNAEFLRGTLAKPMSLALGQGGGAPEESAFDLVLTNFNLPDWKAFIPTNVNLASGRVGANVKLVSRQGGKELLVAGTAGLTELTGAVQSNRFDRFETVVDLDLAMRGPALEIKKCSGILRQSGQAGGAFDVSGNYHLTNKAGLITAKLTDLNQNVLKSFIAAALGDKQLESVTINSATTAKLDGPTDMAVKAELHVANLVVNDPSGQVPKTPLAIDLVADVSDVKGVLDLRQVQLALAKTERAPNSLNVAGRIDRSKTNAWTGNVKITSEGLDVTPYYDLFAKKTDTDTPATAKDSTPPPKVEPQPRPETEPEPMTLPFTQFVGDINIAKFFLREVAISNLITKATIDNGRVNVNPLSLTLNGGAIDLTTLANVAVRGYEYDVNAKLDRVPVEPLVNSFAPEKRGQFKGDLLAGAQIKGAGITGAGLKKSLQGNVLVTLTNANVQISQNKWVQSLLEPLAVVLATPELAQSPLTWIDAKVGMGGGTVTITNATVRSSLFSAGLGGTMTLNDPLTNSTFNNLPVQIAVVGSVAKRLQFLSTSGTGTNDIVMLPQFYAIGGTLGKPNPHIDKSALLKGAASEVIGRVGGDAGRILRGVGGAFGLGPTNQTATGTNAGQTNAPSTNATQNLLRGLGGLLQRQPNTNTATTNPPAEKKPGGFKLNDLLK